VLDIHHLLARGCLEPGWTGTGSVVPGEVAIDVRAGVRQLYISWRPINDPANPGSGSPASSPASSLGNGSSSGAPEETVGGTEVISIFHVTYRCGARHHYFVCPGAGFGGHVLHLYLAQRRFLCRHCSKLIYTSQYERPWQRAHRRASKLRQRLGIVGASVPGKPKKMRMRAYERLLEETLRTETWATEASTARLQQLAAWVESRHKPPFTLD
jgi:hypothetical protein